MLISCKCSSHLFLVVPNSASSVLFESGVVAAFPSAGTNVVPHLCATPPTHTYININNINKRHLYTSSPVLPTYFLFLHCNQGYSQTHPVGTSQIFTQTLTDCNLHVMIQDKRWPSPVRSANSSNAMNIVLLLIWQSHVYHCRTEHNIAIICFLIHFR